MTAKEKTTTTGSAKGKAEGSEDEARAEARRLLERSKTLLKSGLDYRPITFSQAGELTDKIIEQDNNVQVYAFTKLLHGIVAAYFDRKQGGLNGPDVESIVFEAVRHAYTKATLFQDAIQELVNLPPGTVEAMQDDELREEIWGEEGDES